MSTKKISQADVDSRLLQGNFRRTTEVTTLSDPIADTPMVVTLDQLRPYEHNPRLTRNPEYENIKASIRARGLDASPPITRRPGAEHYIISNGGNTRLAILNELWQETREERFYRIHCLFRPWAGDVSALLGHLTENDLHGALSFIERALAVAKAKTFYEQDGESLSQRELVRRLKADGYPVSQTLISRMLDALEHLLPFMPNILYAGLGRPQVEKLLNLHKSALHAWRKHSEEDQVFTELWTNTLSEFDSMPDEFSFSRMQDELLGRMSQALSQSYKLLVLDMAESEGPPPLAEPAVVQPLPGVTSLSLPLEESAGPPARAQTPIQQPVDAEREPAPLTVQPTAMNSPSTSPMPTGSAKEPAPLETAQDPEERQARIDGHVVSPVSTTPRVRQIKAQIAREQFGEVLPDFEQCAVEAILVQAGGLNPVSDVWYIERSIDTPEQLRHHIGNLALELAQYGGLTDALVKTGEGLGFALRQTAMRPGSVRSVAISLLLTAVLRAHDRAEPEGQCLLPGALFGQILMGVYDIPLHGRPAEDIGLERLPDTLLIKLFRLARRLVDLMTGDSRVAH